MSGQRLRKMERAVGNGEVDTGGNDIKVVTLDRHAIRRLQHSHRGVAREQIDHHAFVRWVEVLNQDERHAVIGGQRTQEFAARLQATGRGTNSDEREVTGGRRPVCGVAA